MAFTVDDVVEAVRYETARWKELSQPHGAVLRRLNRAVPQLHQEARFADSTFMAQKLGILVKATDYAEFPGAAAASVVSAVDSPAGDLLEIDPTTEYDSGVADATSTATTLVDTTKAWSVDEHQGRYVQITFGTGKGQIRKISSNTADTLTIETAYPWTTTPDANSVYRIVAADVEAQDDLKLLKGIEPTESQRGFSVKVDTATGTAYIAPDEPLEVESRAGVPMPEFTRVIDAVIYRAELGSLSPIEATHVHYTLRHQPPRRPAFYIVNDELYLIDPGADYRVEDELEVRYLPVPPRLTGPSSTVLLPDAARSWCEWECCKALEGAAPTGRMGEWQAEAQAAKSTFLASLVGKVGYKRVKEVW